MCFSYYECMNEYIIYVAANTIIWYFIQFSYNAIFFVILQTYKFPKSFPCNKKRTTECINQFHTTCWKPKYIYHTYKTNEFKTCNKFIWNRRTTCTTT